jgi:hypothetical protein
MFTYQVHTIESAPGKSKPALEQLERVFGFVPNIAGAIANSPVLANSLLGLFQNVHGGSFTEAEIQTLLLTNAVSFTLQRARRSSAEAAVVAVCFN